MKKTFVNPEMNISLFEMENVVTDSSNAGQALDALKKAEVSETNITEINWAF